MEQYEISNALETLLAATAAAGGTVGDHLRPGLMADGVAATLAALSLPPHPHLVEWFGVHDGTDLDGPPRPYSTLELGGKWRVLGSEEATAKRDNARTFLHEFELADPAYFPNSWFPILEWPNGGLLCIDCEDPSGKLYQYLYPEGTPEVDATTPAFSNIVEFIEAVVFLLEGGFTQWTSDKRGFTLTPPSDLPQAFKERHPRAVRW